MMTMMMMMWSPISVRFSPGSRPIPVVHARSGLSASRWSRARHCECAPFAMDSGTVLAQLPLGSCLVLAGFPLGSRRLLFGPRPAHRPVLAQCSPSPHGSRSLGPCWFLSNVAGSL
eukprot:2575705-Karenia_brevis.AAC.1